MKYRLIIGDPAWAHDVPTDPGAYSQVALTAGNTAAQREQLVAEHKILQKTTMITWALKMQEKSEFCTR